MRRAEAIRFLVLRSLGNFLVLLSLYGVYTIFGPVISYEVQYRIIQVRGVNFTVKDIASGIPSADSPYEQQRAPQDEQTISFADILAGDKEQILMPKDTLFSILIPKIGASSKVFPNVNPDNPEEFSQILSEGVAHARGTVFPGHAGNIYLFAHSAANWWDAGRYNAIFYTLNHLSPQDEIVVFFENTKFVYVVTNKEILESDDTRYLTQQHSGKEQLVLQTCWPPGTTWKRMYVVAERKNADEQE